MSYTLYDGLSFCPFNGDYTSGPVGAFFADDHTHCEAADTSAISLGHSMGPDHCDRTAQRRHLDVSG
ncbi:hypothetical protein [Nonomuraea sp. SYSU D8015]|uniref:hypothetical protein n=1 Tax=Nonomuraea sp. SYSU D8015 TaxID=2593644 RepID=UPI001CB75041|nr:hypothetical protein [Nonomuraea sp. SYSU D8015]